MSNHIFTLVRGVKEGPLSSFETFNFALVYICIVEILEVNEVFYFIVFFLRSCSRDGVVSLEEDLKDGCASVVHVSAICRSPSRQTAIILAQDPGKCVICVRIAYVADKTGVLDYVFDISLFQREVL